MEAEQGKIVPGPMFSPLELKPLASKLKKVVILTDRGNMSAAETLADVMRDVGFTAKRDSWLEGLTATFAEELAQVPVAGIIGFELEVQGWRPTFKLSQNKPEAERLRVAEGLEAQGAPALATLMRGLPA